VADEIVVFGSMAAGLNRPDSDVDVLCFGERESKLKSRSLDLIVLPRKSVSDPAWLQSELASHVSRYGVWIKGVPEWLTQVGIGEQAVTEKRRRVEAFMRCLPAAWPTLDQRFKRKYSIKVRREAQRLLLMRRGQAVPPTRLLDEYWQDLAAFEGELGEYLHHLAPGGETRFSREFFSLLGQNLSTSVRNGSEFIRTAHQT